MRNKIIPVCLFLTAISLLSCKDYDKNEAHFGDSDLPLIFVEGWTKPMNINTGDSINISPLVSPSNGATYIWTLDNTELSKERILKYKANVAPGTYRLQFSVERNGVGNSYSGDIIVAE